MDELDQLRSRIDEVDMRLLAALGERLTVVKQIGAIKAALGLPIRDTRREQDVIENLAQAGRSMGVEDALITKLWSLLFEAAYVVEGRER